MVPFSVENPLVGNVIPVNILYVKHLAIPSAHGRNAADQRGASLLSPDAVSEGGARRVRAPPEGGARSVLLPLRGAVRSQPVPRGPPAHGRDQTPDVRVQQQRHPVGRQARRTGTRRARRFPNGPTI